MNKRLRRAGGGFQVEGSETVHATIKAAARAADLPANTYWDYDREQAMVPSGAGKWRLDWFDIVGFLLVAGLVVRFLL